MSDLWYGTSGPRDAPILICGESWGEEENRQKKPFVGTSGQDLTKLLGEANISRTGCFVTNVISEQPPKNDMKQFFYASSDAKETKLYPTRGLYPMPHVSASLERLYKQIETVNPKLIIGLGNYTLWAFTDNCFGVADEGKKGEKRRKVPTGITSWRGSQLWFDRNAAKPIPFLPTYHPAAAMRQWPWRYDILHDLRMRVPRALKKEWNPPQYNFLIQPTFREVMEQLNWILGRLSDQECVPLAVDLESLPNYHIACLGIAWSTLDAFCIPFCTRTYENYWRIEEEILIVEKLREVLTHPNAFIIGQNFLYDAQLFALYWGIKVICKFDTMLMQHLCWPGKPKSLSYISSLYNKYHSHWKEEGKEYNPRFNDHTHWQYNCKDCVNTFEAHLHLAGLIEKLGLVEQARTQMIQFPMVLEMMLRGTRWDRQAANDLAKELAEDIGITVKELNEMLGELAKPRPKAKPWHSSPLQQQHIFYDLLGVPECVDPKTGSRTIDDEALDTVMSREPLLRPVCEKMKHLRSLRIFDKNFVRAKVNIDQRIRGSYDPSGTVTFRYACKKAFDNTGTNLQTIPAGEVD